MMNRSSSVFLIPFSTFSFTLWRVIKKQGLLTSQELCKDLQSEIDTADDER